MATEARFTRNDDLALWELSEIADAIADKRIYLRRGRPKACLARIESWQPRVNAFLQDLQGEGPRTGQGDGRRACRRQAARRPLHGVPMAHKDMYYRKGELSTGGQRCIRRDWRAPVTATVLDKLDAAGVVELGFPQHGVEFAAGPDRPQRASRPLPQSVGPDARDRRQLERLGRLPESARAWSSARCYQFRHRRLDPPACRGLRRGRHES